MKALCLRQAVCSLTAARTGPLGPLYLFLGLWIKSCTLAELLEAMQVNKSSTVYLSSS